MYRKRCPKPDGGIPGFYHRTTVCFMVLLVIGVPPATSLAECDPVGTWKGTWYSFDGASGPIEVVTSSDGRVVGKMEWDLRPDLPQVLTFNVNTTLTTGPGDCEMSYSFVDTQPVEPVPGYWIDVTLDIDIVGSSTECDSASGTYSGTSYVQGEGTFPEGGTWDVRRTSPPDKVTNMRPGDGAKNVNVWSILDWSWPPTYGYGACMYDVYLGTDLDAVNPDVAPGGGTQPEMTYDPGKLLRGTTYYWRVDAKNTNGATKGNVWRFTTCGPDMSPYGMVYFEALQKLAERWLEGGCADPGWCEAMDLDCSGGTDFIDFAIFGEYWLTELSMLGHWKMDDNEPNTAVVDSSGRGNNGNAQKNTSILQTPGVIEGALSFDGASDFISIPDRDEWTLDGDFTITLWASFNAFNSKWWQAAFVGHDEGQGARNKWIFSYDPAGRTTLFHINGPQKADIRGEPWAAESGEWYFIGVSRSADIYTFYRQGEPDGSIANSATIPDAAVALTIGWAEEAGKFDGAIDDVRIYGRALSPGEIEALFNEGLGE